MNLMEVKFEDLATSDLTVDCIYKGGITPNISAEPFHLLIPNCCNSGGFRKVLRIDDSKKSAFVVLYTSMEELEWPDYLDEETGIFRYYGDNRKPGRAITDTKKKGNKVLEDTFALLNSGGSLDDMPPFLIFKKTGNGRDIQFLGLAAPGNPKISPDRDLVAFWRTVKDKRFQNYEAYFTILDTGKENIKREWLESLIYNHADSDKYAPKVWLDFKQKGRNGIKALQAPRMHKIPTKYEQLQTSEMGKKCLQIIRDYYHDNEYGFEACAVDIIGKIDKNFVDFTLTRPWRDGGRDAIGYYQISQNSTVNAPLRLDCSLEAKCYAETNGVGVRQMSRLISRLKYRQFGVMVTTGYVDKQAYEEVVEDGHPILIVTASDIAKVLINNSIDEYNIKGWLDSISDARFDTLS